MLVNAETPTPTAAQIRGSVAVRIVGELVTRLAGGEAWDFAAFGRDDELVASGSSNSTSADVATLRAEVRLQRFGGASLPHVGTSLAAETRRALFVIFG